MNILVTGACGQLGSEIRNVAMEYGEHRFIFSDVSSLPGMETLFLDITDAEALRLVMANEKVDAIIEETYKMDGIYYIRVWLNEGELEVGDDIMYVLIGGDIRPRVIDGLQYLVGRIKNECVVETELH